MIIETHEILGYKVGNEEVCGECLTAEETTEVEEDALIRKGETDPNTQGFCNRCKKRLW